MAGDFSVSELIEKGSAFMKKYPIALAVALMVCMLGVTASAETEDFVSYVEVAGDSRAAEKEDEAITEEYWAVMDEMDPEELDLKTRMEIMTEAYENAGWTVIHETPAVTRSVDIDPKVWELAYLDINEADPEMREKIIDAREVVISQYSWQNDIEAPDMVSYVINPFDREITFSPLYRELFPGWDPPRPAQTGENVLGDLDVGIVESVLKGVERILSRA